DRREVRGAHIVLLGERGECLHDAIALVEDKHPRRLGFAAVKPFGLHHVLRGLRMVSARAPCAARSASSRTRSPMSSPAEVVTGALGSLCVTMYVAISSMGTCGRKVLGPGRMADSAVRFPSRSSCSARRRPITIRSSLITTQTSHPADRTRLRTIGRDSVG